MRGAVHTERFREDLVKDLWFMLIAETKHSKEALVFLEVQEKQQAYSQRGEEVRHGATLLQAAVGERARLRRRGMCPLHSTHLAARQPAPVMHGKWQRRKSLTAEELPQ